MIRSSSPTPLAPPRLTFGHPELEPDRLVLGDNASVLADLPPGSIDLIYVDPPFGTGRARSSAVGYKWVDPSLEAFLSWMEPRLAGMRRALAHRGLLFVHLDWRSAHYVKVLLDQIFSPRLLVNEIIWCYSVGGKGSRSFGRKHDTILCYARSADYRFHADAVRIARKPNSHMRLEAGPDGRPVQVKRDRKTGKEYRYPVHSGKVPDDCWTDIETLNRSARERTGWPTQKPEALIERILLAGSAPGDRIADLCSGSGTTAVVAQRLGRRFLAVDLEPDAIRLTAERLTHAGGALAADGRTLPDVAIEGPIEASRLGGFKQP